jgi:hypothetical protein
MEMGRQKNLILQQAAFFSWVLLLPCSWSQYTADKALKTK